MRVAVCIPVRGDTAGLARTLAALGAVETGGHGLDVIVALDGPDATADATARRAGAEVVVVEPAGGSYAARNAAIAALGDDVDAVLFTDAGCVPEPKWVLAHVDTLESSDLSGGAIARTYAGRRPTPAEYVDAVRNLTQRTYVEADGFAVTANLAVRRRVLDVVRFDATLRSGGDRDFCHRAAEAGFTLAYSPDAGVVHDCRPTVRALTAKARRVGAGVAALPGVSQPVMLPEPRLGLGLARRATREGVSRNPLWLARTALADRARTRAFARAALAGGWRPRARQVDVVVMLGSRFETLEAVPTRWRHVIDAWRADDRVARVTVVDHPRYRRRLLAAPRRRLAHAHPSPHADVAVVDATVPCAADPGRLGPLAFRRAAAAIEAALPAPVGPRLVVATTPLWATVAPHLRADWLLFDAVDDQRALPSLGARRAWVEAGYRAVKTFDAVTAVSRPLAAELGGIHVGNGVDVAAYATATPVPPAAVGGRPFAVYVGTVQERVDLDLLESCARAAAPDHAVAVAGPCPAAVRARLAAVPGLVLLGPVAPAGVPSLLAAATVGIVPHVVGPLTASMDPMKVLEYLAAGLPVVSTPVALPAGTEHVVDVARGEAFVRTVLARLGHDTEHHDAAAERAERVAAVADRSWADVGRTLLDLATGDAA